MADVRLSSSLRKRTAAESLDIATNIARGRGISRVVDTTWLDKIGIPVFASIRPDGVKGSLCVHAGKGFTLEEAKIGAFMEAIEFSFSPPDRNNVPWIMASPQKIIDSFHGKINFPDFAPRLGQRISLNDEIAVTEGDEILSGLGNVWLPAELVYFPFHQNPGPRLYGTTTNGLASGNDIDEATVHGLAEVMERHVRSFEILNDQSLLVSKESTPPIIKAMFTKIEEAGFRCYLRYSENIFKFPYFAAYILEPDELSLISVASGFGLHVLSEIAAVRAISEAVQGRLTSIHGGRDDLMNRVNRVKETGKDVELKQVKLLRTMAARAEQVVDFAELPNFDKSVKTISEALQCLFQGLRRANMKYCIRVQLSEPSFPFSIVKIIVPGAEMYENELQRVGPRLLRQFANG